MKIILCDIRNECVLALQKQFEGQPNVKVVCKDITKTKSKTWATAGNSFGDMGGGIDKSIDDFFKGEAQRLVQREIQSRYFGELPVGSAISVWPSPRKSHLIYAPSMRVPGNLGKSINAYLAMRAILIEAISSNVKILSCPLIGTGVGGLQPQDAADQMFQAYRLIVLGEWEEIHHSVQAPYVMR